MNRIHKYRGKRVDNGEWVYGYYNYCSLGGKHIIAVNNDYEEERTYYSYQKEAMFYEVIPETVGQYIGLDDNNNKEMYEGDIVKALKRDYDCRDDRDKCYQKFEVAYLNGCYLFGGWNAHEFFNRFIYKEIVGNKTDNPELLGK